MVVCPCACVSFLVNSRNVTTPVDAETLCFLDVVAYVRADTDASAACRLAVKNSYGGNSGKPVREAICRMTDYVRNLTHLRADCLFDVLPR